MSKSSIWRALAPGALFAILALLLALPVLRAPPLVHDSFWIDYVWLRRFAAGLADGAYYPRWLPDSFAGLGAPVFYFYAPLAFYLAAIPCLLGLAAYPALILTFLVLHIASGWTMYRWLGGRGRPALLGAALYMLLPYHIVDFSRRGALAEFAACAVLPLVAGGVRRAVQGRGIVALALAYAMLVMTHLPTALLASVLLIPATALAIGRGRGLAAVAAGALLGLALAAVYLVPALTLQDHVAIGRLWRSGFTPADWSLLTPARWPSPASGSVFATIIAVDALAALVLVGRGGRVWPLLALAICLVAGGLVPGFWSLPLLAKVQFPWRALAIAEFALATAVAEGLAAGLRPLAATVRLLPAIAVALGIAAAPLPSGHPTLAELDRDRPEVSEYLPARPAAQATADRWLAGHSGIGRGAATPPRFWFPGIVFLCPGRTEPGREDPATGLVRAPTAAGCTAATVRTGAERTGGAMTLFALLLTAILAWRNRKSAPQN